MPMVMSMLSGVIWIVIVAFLAHIFFFNIYLARWEFLIIENLLYVGRGVNPSVGFKFR